MADLEFDVVPRRREPISFRLGGNRLIREAEPASSTFPDGRPAERGPDDHDYVFHPPKNASMLLPILRSDTASAGLSATKATFDWLGDGLGKDDNDRLLARLSDPEDDLDVETMEKIVEGLIAKVTSRPTS